MPWSGVLLLGLNLADAALTGLGLSLGVISEANPLITWGLSRQPLATLIFKLVVVSTLIILLARAKRPWVLKSLTALCAVYGLALLLHSIWLFRFLA